MILHQVLFRGCLFDTDIQSPEGITSGIILVKYLVGDSLMYEIPHSEILEQLKWGGPNPIRPAVPNSPTYSETILRLMGECWKEDPEDRPNISRIRSVIFTAFAH